MCGSGPEFAIEPIAGLPRLTHRGNRRSRAAEMDGVMPSLATTLKRFFPGGSASSAAREANAVFVVLAIEARRESWPEVAFTKIRLGCDRPIRFGMKSRRRCSRSGNRLHVDGKRR